MTSQNDHEVDHAGSKNYLSEHFK